MSITININNGGGGAMPGMGMPMQGGPIVVPNRTQKNFGHENGNLLSSEHPVRPPNAPVSFGGLGSYTYGQPKKMPCPPRNLPPPPQPMPCKPIPSSAKLTREEVKEVAVKWAKSKCCRSAKPFEEGHITDMYSCNALEYTLETFTEIRSIGCNFGQVGPGQTLDAYNPNSAVLPNPWLMAAQPNQPFANSVVRLPIPHTEQLQPCFHCQQYGYLKCSHCEGKGYNRCLMCGGDGKTRNAQGGQDRCFACGGDGKTGCMRCSGGRVECSVCRTSTWIKWFLEVVVEYVNHVDQYINERTEMPDEIVKEHQGDVLAQAEGAQLMPIQDCESNDLNQNSLRLIQKAAQAYNQENQLLQRHKLRAISVVECTCVFETQPFKFWIVGSEQFVHAPTFPSKCSCTIL